MKQKLKLAIEKYLNPENKKSKSALKGAITRILNTATDADIDSLRGVLQELSELPDWLRLRLQKGSLYEDNGCVYGWYSGSQLQAEPIPVRFDVRYDDETTNGFHIVVTGHGKGFCPPVKLPLRGGIVDVPIEDDLKFLELWKYGWASALPLQWFYGERQVWGDREGSIIQDGYIVERSIIPHGFWCAWKWWPGCQFWYLNKRPELFEDADWWGPPHESALPSPAPGSVVLGGQNREFWERNKFYMED